MTIVCVVRHGITRSNIEGRYLGRRDEEMTEEGKQQVLQLAERLSTEGFKAIYHSPLKRAADTAAAIAKHYPSISPTIDDRLIELDLGAFDNLLPDEMRNSSPLEYNARKADKLGYVPRDGESYEMLIARVKPFVVELLAKHLGEKVCVVGHQGVNRGLVGCLMEGLLPKDKIPYIRIPQPGFIKVSVQYKQLLPPLATPEVTFFGELLYQ